MPVCEGRKMCIPSQCVYRYVYSSTITKLPHTSQVCMHPHRRHMSRASLKVLRAATAQVTRRISRLNLQPPTPRTTTSLSLHSMDLCRWVTSVGQQLARSCCGVGARRVSI